jgi:nudix-type nucleoside diphosphatase (YffH/AdpP family)
MTEIVETVAAGPYRIRRVKHVHRRRDGRCQTLERLVCERGDTAAVLLYSASRGSVVLTRQLRLPALLAGDGDGMMIEAPGGMIEDQPASVAVRREALEETGHRVSELRPVLVTHLNPALAAERTHLFVGEIEEHRQDAGGGLDAEGEDIEVIEVPIATAFEMVQAGEITDAKTILLLYHAALTDLFPAERRSR